MSSFLWASFLGLFIFGAVAQERVIYRGNTRQILVPLGQNSVDRYTPDSEEPIKAYEFGFKMNDGNGTTQHRQEVRQDNGDVKGSYGYNDANGVYRTVEYYTDASGYHAKVTSNEPGLSNKNSANAVFVVENPPVPEQRPLVLIPRGVSYN